MILDNEFSGDLRVENEVIALQNARHQVFVLCLNFGARKNFEHFYGAEIIRISISKFVKKKLVGLNNTIFNLYPIFWSIRIKKFIVEKKIEVLHVHDLWMLNSVYRSNKKFNLPVVADLHENFVHALNYYRFAKTFPGNILISKKKWKQSELEWTQKADQVITVIEEAVDRYTSIGIQKERITVVPNYLNMENFLSLPLDENTVDKFKESFTVTYVGGFDTHRGLESVIKSIPLIKEKIGNLKLVLVGSGSNYESLRRLAKSLSVEEYISFEGWKSHELLPSYIKGSDLCLIPHLKTEHTDNTIPHKLFQYMFFEKPVIASNCNPLIRIINETNAGLIYDSNNEFDLSEKIISLYNGSHLMKEMGRKGKEAVISKYNWEIAAKELKKIYSNKIGLLDTDG